MTSIIQFDALGGPERLAFVDQKAQQPAASEVTIEVRAAGLNRAELMFLAGQYLLQPELPSRIGVEASGVVTATGSGADNVAVGDAVSVFPSINMRQYGVLGTHATVPAWSLIAKPEGVSFTDAAAFWMAYGTAWGGLVMTGGLPEGGGWHVLISAASSSVGLAAIDVAKHRGATVIATTRGADKVERLQAHGADHVIATSSQDLVREVEQITGGKGVNLCFDPIGGDFVELLAQASSRGGKIIQYGGLSGGPTPFPFFSMIGKGLSMQTFHLGFDVAEQPEKFDALKAELGEHLSASRFRPVIDSTFAYADAVAAYGRLASNTQIGKVVIDLDQTDNSVASQTGAQA